MGPHLTNKSNNLKAGLKSPTSCVLSKVCNEHPINMGIACVVFLTIIIGQFIAIKLPGGNSPTCGLVGESPKNVRNIQVLALQEMLPENWKMIVHDVYWAHLRLALFRFP